MGDHEIEAFAEEIKRLILDDVLAMTYQSMGQYRTALAKAVMAGAKAWKPYTRVDARSAMFMGGKSR